MVTVNGAVSESQGFFPKEYSVHRLPHYPVMFPVTDGDGEAEDFDYLTAHNALRCLVV